MPYCAVLLHATAFVPGFCWAPVILVVQPQPSMWSRPWMHVMAAVPFGGCSSRDSDIIVAHEKSQTAAVLWSCIPVDNDMWLAHYRMQTSYSLWVTINICVSCGVVSMLRSCGSLSPWRRWHHHVLRRMLTLHLQKQGKAVNFTDANLFIWMELSYSSQWKLRSAFVSAFSYQYMHSTVTDECGKSLRWEKRYHIV